MADRIRVTLRRNAERGQIKLNITGGEEPTVAQFIARLPRGVAGKGERHLRCGYSLLSTVDLLLSKGVPAGVLTDAISAAMLANQALQAGVTSEAPVDITREDLFTSGAPALLSIGTLLYRLAPIAVVEGAKALKIHRMKIRELVAKEAGELRRAAESEAQEIIRRATQCEQEARQRVEEMRLSPLAQVPASIIENGYPLVLSLSEVRVGLALHVTVTRFERVDGNSKRIWEVPVDSRETATVLLWVPFVPTTGKVNIREARIDKASQELPHACRSSTCLELAREPQPLKDYRAVDNLKRQLVEAFSVVNCNSLLVLAGDWHEAIRDVCPLGVLGACEEGSRSSLWSTVEDPPTWVAELSPSAEQEVWEV